MILSYMMIISVFDVLLFFLKTLKKRQQNQIFYGEISKDKVYGIKWFLLGFLFCLQLILPIDCLINIFSHFIFSCKEFTDLFFRYNHSFRAGEQNVI